MKSSEEDEPRLVVVPELARRVVAGLKDNANAGPETLSPYFLKRCWSQLETPILHIFNSSLAQGHFPEPWRFSHVLPIFKKGDKHDVRNYRPISILGILSKLFDAIMTSVLIDFLLASIAREQHGFVAGRSTLTNLLIFIDYLSEALESSNQLDAINTDFSKAFDTVRHDLLLSKLSHVGVNGRMLCWLASYITGRCFSVRVGDSLSDPVSVTSGVPQGSHLGPLLFCVYINDLVANLEFVKILLYADDIKLYSVVHSDADAQRVQRDLDTLLDWSNRNGLRLNLIKCFIISFSRCRSPLVFDYVLGGASLQRTSVIRDLGVWFDSSLSFDNHIHYLCSKMSSLIGFLKRTTANFSDID